jgi:hypothetical protein
VHAVHRYIFFGQTKKMQHQTNRFLFFGRFVREYTSTQPVGTSNLKLHIRFGQLEAYGDQWVVAITTELGLKSCHEADRHQT